MIKKTQQLKILIWKHALVRRQRLCGTIIEVAVPVILFLLLYKFMAMVKSQPQKSFEINDDDNTPVFRLDDEMTLGRPGTLYYHPNTLYVTLFMDEVGRKLHLNRISDCPPSEPMEGICPLPHNSIIHNITTGDAIIIFHNMAYSNRPRTLNYTIRMLRDYVTAPYTKSLVNINAPARNPMYGFEYLTFMQIQWAIDQTYIKSQTGEDVNQTLTVQEFPFFRSGSAYAAASTALFVPDLCWLVLMIAYVFLMLRLIEERCSGMQELVKMMGVSINVLGFSHWLNAAIPGLVFSVIGSLVVKTMVPKTSCLIVFVMMLLYYNSIIAMAFAVNHVVNNMDYAASVSAITYVISWPLNSVLNSKDMPYGVNFLTGLFPHIPFKWFWREVAFRCFFGGGVTFSNMFSRFPVVNSPCAAVCILFLILQIILFFAISWYLSLVRPGQYGQALPPTFIFKKEFWTKHKPVRHTSTQIGTESIRKSRSKSKMKQFNNEYFETPPLQLTPGIQVVNVTKKYGHFKALNDVSLTAYKGEITVLLGHNGAGKTTLMAIISGMTSATTGNVYVNGLDTVKDQAEVRKHVGLCPQHNIFYPELTVQQHIILFTVLKGGTFAEARKSSAELAERLGLESKLSAKCSSLSGGMKRRTQLGMALSGGSDCLILDEPTSGLDVETRRELWDLLLSLRGDCTVLLSTHFMEEADVLGDRVAALHDGELRCYATTMHLKRAIGSGYRLTLVTFGAPKQAEITAEVTRQLPEATFREITPNSISYNLPASANTKFSHLFSELEKKKLDLGIDSIGVGVSTLEEVFLKICSNVETDFEEEVQADEREYKRCTGFWLYFQQFVVLMKRQCSYIWSKKFMFFLLQVFLPIVVVIYTTSNSNKEDTGLPKNDSRIANFDKYPMPEKRVLLNIMMPKDVEQINFRAINNDYPGLKFYTTNNVAKTIYKIGKRNLYDYYKYVAGIELNETNAKVLYPSTIRHAAPPALNMLSNVLAMRYLHWPSARIHTHNDPIENVVETFPVQRNSKKEPKSIGSAAFWAFVVVFLYEVMMLHYPSLLCKEKVTGARRMHIMSGCPLEFYWFITLIFHMTLLGLTLYLPILLSAAIIDKHYTLSRPDFLLVMTWILFLGCMSLLALTYLLTALFSERVVNLCMIVLIFFCSIIMGLTKYVTDYLWEEDQEIPGYIYFLMGFCTAASPHYVIFTTLLNALQCARLNTMCELQRERLCPSFSSDELGWDDDAMDACCDYNSAKSYYAFSGDLATGPGILSMIAQIIVFMALLFIKERGLLCRPLDKIRNSNYVEPPRDHHDPIVEKETHYCQDTINKPVKDIKYDSLIVNNLHKNYAALRKSFNALRGVSFSVRKGECFGLLGANGAGKSTTFKIITTAECPTRGRIFANGYHLTPCYSKYIRTLGYCPQFYGLDMFLTGKQNLELILTLRGHEKTRVKEGSQEWIDIVGLERYADNRIGTYSGGCCRRLVTAGALCGGAELTLLDEPTAGVDVAARRRLWTAIRKTLKEKRSMVVTSHSMDEMEALCSRIAIMCVGQIRAVGEPASLRASHSSGHAVLIKMKNMEDIQARSIKLAALKEKFQSKFKCSLNDEHWTMLHYHINETMQYSVLFSELEQLKNEFPELFEDYSVTETTLEEVFLAFAKEAKHKDDTPKNDKDQASHPV